MMLNPFISLDTGGGGEPPGGRLGSGDGQEPAGVFRPPSVRPLLPSPWIQLLPLLLLLLPSSHLQIRLCSRSALQTSLCSSGYLLRSCSGYLLRPCSGCLLRPRSSSIHGWKPVPRPGEENSKSISDFSWEIKCSVGRVRELELWILQRQLHEGGGRKHVRRGAGR